MYRYENAEDWNLSGYPGNYIFGDEIYIDDYYMDERWKPIRGFGLDYWVSNLARVWSVKNQIFLKVKPMDDHGHLGVCLYKNNKRYYKYIHRLVADAFLPNPKNLPLVRHLDDVPYYNTDRDIAWGTVKDNIFDAIRNGKAYMFSDFDRKKGFEKTRTPIIAINLRTGEELNFRGQGEASRILGIPQANIWKVLNKQRSHAQGYTFEYIERSERNGNY